MMSSIMPKWFLKIFLLFILGLVQKSHAQFGNQYGKCTDYELNLTHYAKDSIAEALVIYDMGTVSFVPEGGGFNRIFERTTKIKIFNKKGFKWSEISIPYYIDDSYAEKILSLEGSTYNLENGKQRVTALDLKNVYEEKFDKGLVVKKFAMPDIREGSVVEIKYSIESSIVFTLPTWEFQWKIPVVYSEYKTKMIPYYTYMHLLQGAERCDVYQEYEEDGPAHAYGTETYYDKVQVYGMKDLPAFRDESFISSYNDYIVKLDFQLAKVRQLTRGTSTVVATWQEMLHGMFNNKDFEAFLKTAQVLAKDFVAAWVSKPELEKAEAIDKYMKHNFNWNGYDAKTADKSPKDFLKTKIGNAASMNLFYVAMLKEVGIEAYPVLISTRGNGKIYDSYPFTHLLNSVIVLAKIGGKNYALDATNPVCNFAELPARCLNDKGLVIKKDHDRVEWFDFSPKDTSNLIFNIELILDIEADSTKGDYTVTASGCEALAWRMNDMDNSKEGLSNDLPIQHLNIKNTGNIERPRRLGEGYGIKFKATEAVTWVGGRLILSPFSNLVMTVNPFTASRRNYPIDLIYRRYKSYTSIIHIPKYLKIAVMPTSLDTLDDENINISYEVKQIDEYTLEIKGSYLLKKDIYPASSYTYLKASFDTIIKKFNENLVLVKKK